MSSSRDFPGSNKGGFSDYEWEDDVKNNPGARPPKNAKKGVSSNASSSAGSALSLAEVSCDAISIMEWATDLLSPSNQKNAQDAFAENNLNVSPLRHRKITTPSNIRSKRQGTFPPEQRLPKNDLPGPQMKGVPNWEGTTITADAQNSEEVSVMTPFGGNEQRDYPKTTHTNINSSASGPHDFGNWDHFEVSRWDSGFPEQSSNFSENEEGMDAAYKKQPVLPRNKKKLIWVGSIAVFLILIIAIAVPLSKNSNNAAASIDNEKISTGLENNTTVPVESESSLSQTASSPESETVDESFVNGQATTIPVESIPAPPQPKPSVVNEPVSSPISTVAESKPTQSQPSVPAQNPVASSNNQQNTGSNSVGVQSPANPQSVTVPNPQLTPNPTQFPTLPPTPSCINVEITTDKFGHETSWVLTDVNRNREIASVPEDTYGANEEVSQELCGLESGKYKFIIRDKYGDGMCCGNGKGRYRVFLNGQQIIWGGYFKKELSFDILVGYDHGTLTDREYEYWVGHNRRRKEFHEKHGTEYIPLAWSHSLADRARAWATTLLDECDDVSIRHDPNRKGDGENLAKNFGSSATAGMGQLQPVEKVMGRWVEREMTWDWPENAHLTQALWRGSSYVGCADAEEIKSDGSICRVQVCRYRRSGNCNMGSFNGDWLTAMLQDETTCGEQCPEEGCYVTSFMK